MTLPALALPEDVEARLGTTVDGPRVTALLDDASALVRAFVGRLWVDEHGDLTDLPDGVPGVVAGMVVRAIQNPTGVTQDTAGPWSVSYGTAAAQRIYLSGPDKMILRGAVGASGLSTITTTRGPIETELVDRSGGHGGLALDFWPT